MTFESGILPAVPPGLAWTTGLCCECLHLRDVTDFGIAAMDGDTVPLAICRFCLGYKRHNIAEVRRFHRYATAAGWRAHRIARWSRARTRRVRSRGRHAVSAAT
ncbi:hypothetical protein [Kitasatospora sp. NPDC059571]|uniref:hypothetical protein n=1 Tax=Kitasatospora sp. NPDC059571 TaxID=3346871 RepID=UPI0036924AFD